MLARRRERAQGLLLHSPLEEARRQAGRRRRRLLHDDSGRPRTPLRSLRDTLDPADGLWIAWPKKASKLDTDLDFDAVQRIGLEAGLVDNKSATIDADWQAVRFVYRLEDRRPG